MERENSQAMGGKKWDFARRFVHVLLSIGAFYYWLPEALVPGFPKWYLLIIGLAVIVFIECMRFGMKVKLPWSRPYEEGRLAAHTYAAFGAVTVFLISPDVIGAPAIVAMAWADPIAGELRRRGRSRTVSAIACALSYGIITLTVMTLIVGTFYLSSLILIIPMTVAATLSEQVNTKYLDDDLLMLVLPALVGIMIYTSSIQSF